MDDIDHNSPFHFLKVNPSNGTFHDIYQLGFPVDLASDKPLQIGQVYFLSGFKYNDRTFYNDIHYTVEEAQASLFALNKQYNSNCLTHIEVVVGDLTGIVSCDKVKDYRPKFFVREMTFQ